MLAFQLFAESRDQGADLDVRGLEELLLSDVAHEIDYFKDAYHIYNPANSLVIKTIY